MEQIERTRRYLKRIRDIYEGVPYIAETRECYTDDVISFFIHCHHIADWVMKLEGFSIQKKDVEQFIDVHPELRICADLCNGAKHCRLTKKMRGSKQPHVSGRTFESSGTNGVFQTTKCRFEILSDNQIFDARDLAETCMALWDDFIETSKKTDGNSLS